MRTSNPAPRLAPSLRGRELWGARHPTERGWQLMTADETARLAAISTVTRFKRGQSVYAQGESADAVFNVINGVVQITRSAGGRRRHVVAFIYPGDVFGLSEEGSYVNAATAATPLTAYCIPVTALRRLLARDPELDLIVIAKLCEELRQAQRHAFLLAENSAAVRIMMFLDLQAQLQSFHGAAAREIQLPMQRAAIAEYVALSEAALSRGFRALVAAGVIAFADRQHVRVLDVETFDALAKGDQPPARALS